MPRSCSICIHEQKGNIESDILTGTSLRKVAEKYGLSHASVNRHKIKCITKAIRKVQKASKITPEQKAIEKKQKAIEKKETVDLLSGISIVKTLNELATDLKGLRDKAETNNQYSAAIAATKEQIRMTENLLKRAEELMRFEAEQSNSDEIIYKEDLPTEIDHLLNSILNDPDLESDNVEAEYEIVSEN